MAALIALAAVGILGEVAWHWTRTDIDFAVLAVICALSAVGIACWILYGD